MSQNSQNSDETSLKRKLEDLTLSTHSPKRRNTDEMALQCGYDPEMFVMDSHVSDLYLCLSNIKLCYVINHTFYLFEGIG